MTFINPCFLQISCFCTKFILLFQGFILLNIQVKVINMFMESEVDLAVHYIKIDHVMNAIGRRRTSLPSFLQTIFTEIMFLFSVIVYCYFILLSDYS